MNASIFTAAHATAKATRNNFASYRAAFAFALKAEYIKAKAPIEPPVYFVFDKKSNNLIKTYTTKQLIEELSKSVAGRREMSDNEVSEYWDYSDAYHYSIAQKNEVMFNFSYADTVKTARMMGYKF